VYSVQLLVGARSREPECGKPAHMHELRGGHMPMAWARGGVSNVLSVIVPSVVNRLNQCSITDQSMTMVTGSNGGPWAGHTADAFGTTRE
jgi:hypothetical protein